MGALTIFRKGLRVTAIADRLENSSFGIPAKIIQPDADCRLTDTGNARPLRHGFSLTVDRQHGVVTSIARLLDRSRPAAITGFIVAGIIDTIDRVVRCGRLAHVGEEIHEVSPVVANLDPAAAPVSPPRIVRVGASLDHRCPDMMDLGVGEPMLELSGFHPFGRTFSMQAATRLSDAVFQRIWHRLSELAAIALANPPKRSTRSWLALPQNDEPTETLSGKIIEFWHNQDNALVYVARQVGA